MITGYAEYCRHPMYGGLIVAAAGLTLATGDEVRLAMALLLAAVLSEKVSRPFDALQGLLRIDQLCLGLGHGRICLPSCGGE